MKPTVGRIVHYQEESNRRTSLAAIVTAVSSSPAAEPMYPQIGNVFDWRLSGEKSVEVTVTEYHGLHVTLALKGGGPSFEVSLEELRENVIPDPAIDMVSLCVLKEDGMEFKGRVRHAYQDKPTPGHWNWAPRER